MQTRPRLVTNVPFWVLVIASLAAVIGGLVLVLRQVDAIQALVNDPNATVVTVYVAQSWVSVGAAVLAAGAIGLASALAVATVVSTRTNPDVAIETIDWTSDDESAAEQIPAFATGTAATSPVELYSGERLQGAFERTASRLIEMQSADYLSTAHKA